MRRALPANPFPATVNLQGFYLWNHSSTTVVNGQTFQQWFIHSYMLNAVGSSPLVSGFFWDDFWPGESGNFPDSSEGRIVNDTGMTKGDLTQITASYWANMAALQAETLSRGKFSWQMLWTGGAADSRGSTGPGPLVTAASCASDLLKLCDPTSPQFVNRTMMYAFSNRDPSLANKTLFTADLANFLLSSSNTPPLQRRVVALAPLLTRSCSTSVNTNPTDPHSHACSPRRLRISRPWMAGLQS